MPRIESEPTLKEIKKSLLVKNCKRKSYIKRTKSKLKPQTHENDTCSTVTKKRIIKYVRKSLKNDGSGSVVKKGIVRKTKSAGKKDCLSNKGDKPVSVCTKEKQKHANKVVKSTNLKKRRKRKRLKDNGELDEASRLQRRTRYLLIKIKREQDLIDAYSGEGWKGQSREKIKPERELQRAQKQIRKCKLGIRDAIHQIDLLSPSGGIDDTRTGPSESTHHEHMICFKCKSRDTSSDNDIIPCYGACNCAFHQKCIDPPLLSGNREESWFCKFCDCKREILEAMNAHLGTSFSLDSNWQDIFKEEALLPDDSDCFFRPEEEWPSDDSEDDDYNPGKVENSCSDRWEDSEDASSSSSLWSLEDEFFSESEQEEMMSKDYQCTLSLLNSRTGCDDINLETFHGRRQRKAIDYIKLDEMLEKETHPVEQISDDEDWLPTKRRRKEKESDAASTLMTLSDNERRLLNANENVVKKSVSSRPTKRPFSRIPHHAVERLRLVFSENELPSKVVKENLSKQLGLESGKVNKWFKNARYLALKARKVHGEHSFNADGCKVPQDFKPTSEMGKPADHSASMNIAVAKIVSESKTLKLCRRKRPRPLVNCAGKKLANGSLLSSPAGVKAAFEFGDDVSLKILREKARREKKKVDLKPADGLEEAEAQMERLCEIKNRVECLQQVLLRLAAPKCKRKEKPNLNESPSIIYVPVAELREKR